MRIDKGQISGQRLLYTMFCYLLASSFLTSFLTGVIKQDMWFVVFCGLIVCLLLMWLFRTLMVLFPNMNLIQMLENVFGPVIGKVLSVGYIWFFVNLTSLHMYDLGNLTRLTIMEETPVIGLVIMCVAVTTYAVRNGIKAVTWYGGLLMMISIVMLLLTVLLVMNQMRFERFLPMLTLPAKKYVQGIHVISTIPFGELVMLLMINPNVSMSRREVTKYVFLGFLLGGCTIIIVVVRDTAVLGNIMGMFEQPSLATLRMVRLGEALSRMEILFAVALVSQLFFKGMILHYVSVMAIAQIFHVKSYRYIALVTGAFIVAYGSTLYKDSIEHAASARETVPFIWSFFEMLIPLVLFLVAKMRRLPRKREA